MLSTLNGLVIRSVNYKESDKILTLITTERGRITVKARGARRKNSPLLSAGQLFCYGSMTIFENRGKATLNEMQVLETFSGLSRNIEAMTLACYFAEILSTEPEDSEIHPDILRLMLNSLHALAKELYPCDLIKAAFELRYLALTGYAPDLGACTVCGKETGETGGWFDPGRDGMLCSGCIERGTGLPLDGAALAAGEYILRCDLKRLFSFALSEASLALLSAFTQAYLRSKLERDFPSLKLYTQLTRFSAGSIDQGDIE